MIELAKIKFAIVFLLSLIISNVSYSQEDSVQDKIPMELEETKNIEDKSDIQESRSIKPLRVGLKIGVPSLFNINVEYVTPLLDNRVSFAIDYFPITVNVDETTAKLNNFEIGSNIYLNNKGKGLYAGISYLSFNAKATLAEFEFDDDNIANAKTEIKFTTFNFKIGAKLGRVFYFRVEVGYGIGSIPSVIIIKEINGSSVNIEDISEVPVITSSGLPFFNFGFGVGFL